VRHNGGSQAGHTVIDPSGRRHVFHSFGAGAFSGAPTFLSHFFVLNPFLFVKEYLELNALGVKPRVICDPRLLITTPFDVLLNQAVERKRGAARHGSVGAGVGETIARATAGNGTEFRMTAGNLRVGGLLDGMLHHIEKEYLPVRMKQLELEKLEFDDFEPLLQSFKQEVIAMLGVIEEFKWEELQWQGDIIFEGAQGLLLDCEDKKRFPHVSRSKTGIRNVVEMCRPLPPQPINAYYVTRTYLTRHGAGPLEREMRLTHEDQTNTPNEWQGELRFGQVDWDELADSIKADIAGAKHEVIANLAVTCMDQAPAPLVMEGIARDTALKIQAAGLLTSYGPSRTTVREAAIG
jgi:adenylosuccinate synthase